MYLFFSIRFFYLFVVLFYVCVNEDLQFLAVGDDHGSVRVLELPRGYTKPVPNEVCSSNSCLQFLYHFCFRLFVLTAFDAVTFLYHGLVRLWM